MARKVDDPEIRRQIRELHAEEVSRNQIAKRLGVRGVDVTEVALQMGLTFDRSKTRKAVAAHVVDMRARRIAIRDRLYGLSEDTLTRLEDGRDGEYRTVLKGSFGAEEARSLSFVPAQDRHRETAAIASAVRAAIQLDQVDNSGAQAAQSLLVGLAAGFGLHDAQDADEAQ